MPILTCFVDKDGAIHLQNRDGEYLEYQFDLETRTMTVVPWGADRPLRHDAIARNYFDAHVGTPEKLMACVRGSGLTKLGLASLLTPEKKQLYLDTCGRFEKALTEFCAAKNDPCLESGCALEGDACLNAVLETEDAYTSAYVSMWLYLFENPKNRISVWRS